MKTRTLWRLFVPAIVPVLLSNATLAAPATDDALPRSPAICDGNVPDPREGARIVSPALRAIAASVHDQEVPQGMQILLACGMLSLHRREVHKTTLLLRSRDLATRAKARSFIIRREQEIAHYEAWLDELSLLRNGI